MHVLHERAPSQKLIQRNLWKLRIKSSKKAWLQICYKQLKIDLQIFLNAL